MLTRSPVPAGSANASPGYHSFHYAHSVSPRQSPSRTSIAVSRRQSTATASPATSLKSPSLSRPKRYVAVDAATQYSPMERVDYYAPRPSQHPPLTTPSPSADPPRPAGPVPMEPGIEQGAGQPPVAGVAAAGSSAPPNPITSPSKRRHSQGAEPADGPSVVHSPSTLPKRPKPEMEAPKVLPQRYELCETEDIVTLIAHMLGELIETNDALARRTGHLTRFHSRTAPGISVRDYLQRLAKHATLTPPILLAMVYFIDRLCTAYSDFTINTLTVHRFLITAATVASKGLSDAFWNNSTYARVGGVRVAELKLLELEFLHRVDWKIVPQPDVLVSYYRGLVLRCPGYVLAGEEEATDTAHAPNVSHPSNGSNSHAESNPRDATRNTNGSEANGHTEEEEDDDDEIDDSDELDDDEDDKSEGKGRDAIVTESSTSQPG